MDNEIQLLKVGLKNKKQLIIVFFIALIAILIAGIIILFFANQLKDRKIKSLQEQTENFKNVQINNQENQKFGIKEAFNKNLILMAYENSFYNSEGDFIAEVFIISLDSKTGEQKPLISMGEMRTDSLGASKDKVFFLTDSGKIGFLEIKSGKQSVLEIPGIDDNQYNPLDGFLVSDKEIFYLLSKEYGYTNLGVYDMITGENRIISNNLLHEQIKAMGTSGLELVSYEPTRNVLRINLGAGGPGGVGIRRFDFDINNEEITEGGREGLFDCENYPEEAKMEIKKCEEENKRFEEFTTLRINCNGATIDKKWYSGLKIITSDKSQVNLGNKFFYVGCITKEE